MFATRQRNHTAPLHRRILKTEMFLMYARGRRCLDAEFWLYGVWPPQCPRKLQTGRLYARRCPRYANQLQAGELQCRSKDQLTHKVTEENDVSTPEAAPRKGKTASKAMVTTTIRLRFHGRSTAYRRSLRSQWRNTGRWPGSRSHADLFIYLGRGAAAHGREWRRRMVIAWSNGGRIAL